MRKEEAKKRIEKLKKVIAHHRYLYHVLDRQEISDAALDSLKHELFNLEQQCPEFVTPDSPTQRVGGAPLKEFKKVEHKTPMLSIEDVFSEKDLEDWESYLKTRERRSRAKGEDETLVSSTNEVKLEYFSELKIDGFAVTLIYEAGVFLAGATRGNGVVGEDVSQNLKTIESIPLKLEIKRGISDKNIETNLRKLIEKGRHSSATRIEIRGEVYMGKADFEKFNKELEKKGEKPYANPRNLAAGSIRQLDPKLAASRPLKFLAYDIVTDMGQKKHSEEHQILPVLGFKTEAGKVCKNLSDIVDFWREIAKKRETLPYQIDGVVISVNNNSLFQKLGVAGKSPRGLRAFKFSPKQATTKVLDIKVQVGRTGAVTPIAYLKPVEVAGVIITKATLHNEDEIKRLGVKIGDTVIIERAGDVIPAVAKTITELRTGKEKEFHFPKNCPVCGIKLIKPKDEAVWRCKNQKCPARKRENLYYFASKKAFDIEGLGPKIIDQLVDENLISQAHDLFTLKEGDLIPLERFAEKSAKNLVEAIQKSKRIPLARFIYALGIRHVGEETAEKLANYLSSVSEDGDEMKFHRFGIINRLMKATREDLEKIPDIGGKVSESIYNWFRLEQNQKFIENLIKTGIKILPPDNPPAGGPPAGGRKFKGKTFVLTGTLKTLTRSEAEKKIRLLGGHPSSSVSEQTDFVVAGLEPGSKLEQAKKLGLKIIKEKEFLEMIK